MTRFDRQLYTRKVKVNSLKPGDILLHDIYLKSGALVAKAGLELTEEQVNKLIKMGDKIVTLDLREVYKKGVIASRKLFSNAAAGKPIILQEVQDFVKPFVAELNREASVIRLLNILQSKDEYTFQHTINIGVLAMAIGKWLGFKGDDLQRLALAGTLHDIGKCRIPLNILNKPGPLTKQEFAIMKNHTLIGHEILLKSGWTDKSVLLAVLQHHERTNGQGYPFGIRAEGIHSSARIVAVADIYHAMTTMRVYRQKKNPYLVLEHLKKNVDSLDPKIVITFIDKMLASLLGCRVILNNGAIGDVVYTDREYISRPLVKIKDKNVFIDLRERKDITISGLIYEPEED